MSESQGFKRAVVASIFTLSVAAGAAALASTQDVAPAPAPAAKVTTPAPKKKPAAKKPQANAAAANKAAKPSAAVACEPSRTFVPVSKEVCSPATPPADGQKFNTLEDIYIPPPEPAKK